jgi:hypothetical protein
LEQSKVVSFADGFESLKQQVEQVVLAIGCGSLNQLRCMAVLAIRPEPPSALL